MPVLQLRHLPEASLGVGCRDNLSHSQAVEVGVASPFDKKHSIKFSVPERSGLLDPVSPLATDIDGGQGNA